MRYDYDAAEGCIIVPEHRVYTINNSVILNNKGEYCVVRQSLPKEKEWFSIKLPANHTLTSGQIVRCGGRYGVSIFRLSAFMDNPPCGDLFVPPRHPYRGSRLPFQEDLKDIPSGMYRVKLSKESNRLAILTLVEADA